MPPYITGNNNGNGNVDGDNHGNGYGNNNQPDGNNQGNGPLWPSTNGRNNKGGTSGQNNTGMPCYISGSNSHNHGLVHYASSMWNSDLMAEARDGIGCLFHQFLVCHNLQ